VIKYNFDLLLHPPHHTLLILAANIPADYLQALDGITVVIVQVLYIQWLHRPGDRPFSIRILQAVLSRAVTYTNTKLLLHLLIFTVYAMVVHCAGQVTYSW